MIAKRGSLVSIPLIFGILLAYLGTQISVIPQLEINTTWVLVVGLCLFTFGLVLHQSENVYKWFEERTGVAANWFGVFHWQVMLLALSPIFTILGAVASGIWPRMHNPFIAIVSWLIGIALIIIGAYVWGEKWPFLSIRTLLLTSTITIIAFLIRGIGTGSFPVILTGDEASAGISAVNFISGGWNNIFIAGWFSFPSFFSFMQSLSIRLFGQTTEALRIVSAIAGALTVTATYLCGKAIFGEQVGILASATLTALHFHIHFSRLGINNIWDGLGYTLTIGAFWYGWSHNKRFSYLLAGLALGFTQYFYATSRGLFGLVIACIVLIFLFQRSQFKKSVPSLVIMLAIAAAVSIPLIAYYIQEPNQFLAPFTRVSSLSNNPGTSIQNIVRQVAIGLQAFTYAHLQNWYRPETPILRPIFATLFYLGLIFLFLKNRDSRLILIAMWLLLFGLIGGLSESPPASQRYVAVAPACALVIGLGLHKTIEIFKNLWPKLSWFITGLGYMVVVIAMISDLSFYFIEYRGMEIIENVASNGAIAQELANYLRDKPEGTQVAFLHNSHMGYYSIPSTLYLAPQIKGIDVPEEWESFDQSQLNSKKIIFVFLADNNNEIETIQKDFPGGLLTSRRTWNSEILFWLYEYESN